MLVDSARACSDDLLAGRRVPVQVIVNGDNANTAATVMGYALRHLQTESAQYQVQASASAAPSCVEPRVWYNPELRSALFLVPGLIAYIGMISAVISTALSVVREKERGTMEQVRMAPLGTMRLRRRQDDAVLRASRCARRCGIILASMVLFELPMNGSWLLLLLVAVAVSGRCARARA